MNQHKALKRKRESHLGHITTEEDNIRATKIINNNKSFIHNFCVDAIYRGDRFTLHLSDIFNHGEFAILFFCDYDFSIQTKRDFTQIEDHYKSFLAYSAIPIVMTQDGINVHRAFTTPGTSPGSLDFEPSFVLASDSCNRLLSAAFKAADHTSSHLNRTVVIINRDHQVLFSYTVPPLRFFPMRAILNCFQNTR
ncbi:hypothetical protein BDB01DRAFT_793181 [Pilobolus umbonatus]|nr:hypothetical protein BDB01DRAFT_793181 [Pilobolus umbonatus]